MQKHQNNHEDNQRQNNKRPKIIDKKTGGRYKEGDSRDIDKTNSGYFIALDALKESGYEFLNRRGEFSNYKEGETVLEPGLKSNGQFLLEKDIGEESVMWDPKNENEIINNPVYDYLIGRSKYLNFKSEMKEPIGNVTFPDFVCKKGNEIIAFELKTPHGHKDCMPISNFFIEFMEHKKNQVELKVPKELQRRSQIMENCKGNVTGVKQILLIDLNSTNTPLIESIKQMNTVFCQENKFKGMIKMQLKDCISEIQFILPGCKLSSIYTTGEIQVLGEMLEKNNISSSKKWRACPSKTDFSNNNFQFIYNGDDIKEVKSKVGEILIKAVYEGDIKKVEELLEFNVDIFFQDRDGNTILHYAIDSPNRNVEMMALLIEAGRDKLLTAQNKKEQTAENYAQMKFDNQLPYNMYLEAKEKVFQPSKTFNY